jgi:hypothetical protein
MSDNSLLEIVRKLSSTAGRLQGKFVLMGGMALSVYAPPRATFDIDAIGDFEDEQLNRFLDDLKEQGFSFDEKAPVKEIAGLKLITLGKADLSGRRD